MSNSIKDQITNDLQKAKETGGTRLSRIREIVQTAAVQALAEVKEGSGEIRTIAHHSFSNAVDNLNSNSATSEVETVVETADEGVNEAPHKTAQISLKTLTLAVFQAVKTRLAVQFQKERSDLQTQFVGLKDRLGNVDEKLTERYGDRYQAAKQRLEGAATWYNTATAQAEAQGTTVLQEKQGELEDKAATLGTAAARKEHQIRQQLKQFLQTTAAKF